MASVVRPRRSHEAATPRPSPSRYTDPDHVGGSARRAIRCASSQLELASRGIEARHSCEGRSALRAGRIVSRRPSIFPETNCMCLWSGSARAYRRAAGVANPILDSPCDKPFTEASVTFSPQTREPRRRPSALPAPLLGEGGRWDGDSTTRFDVGVPLPRGALTLRFSRDAARETPASHRVEVTAHVENDCLVPARPVANRRATRCRPYIIVREFHEKIGKTSTALAKTLLRARRQWRSVWRVCAVSLTSTGGSASGPIRCFSAQRVLAKRARAGRPA